MREEVGIILSLLSSDFPLFCFELLYEQVPTLLERFVPPAGLSFMQLYREKTVSTPINMLVQLNGSFPKHLMQRENPGSEQIPSTPFLPRGKPPTSCILDTQLDSVPCELGCVGCVGGATAGRGCRRTTARRSPRPPPSEGEACDPFFFFFLIAMETDQSKG